MQNNRDMKAKMLYQNFIKWAISDMYRIFKHFQ